MYPAANNTSSISSFCLEMFLNRILKSAIMKHYVLVSIPLTDLRTLFELRKEVELKANEGQYLVHVHVLTTKCRGFVVAQAVSRRPVNA